MDFANELEQVGLRVASLEELISGPEADIPRSCCGRSNAEHWQDDIDALKALECLMTGDEAAFNAHLEAEGLAGEPSYYRRMISLVWREKAQSQDEMTSLCEETERKLREEYPAFEAVMSEPDGNDLAAILARAIGVPKGNIRMMPPIVIGGGGGDEDGKLDEGMSFEDFLRSIGYDGDALPSDDGDIVQ